jgi:hypothetical protein
VTDPNLWCPALGHEHRFCDVCGTSVTADILNRQLRAKNSHSSGQDRLQRTESYRKAGFVPVALSVIGSLSNIEHGISNRADVGVDALEIAQDVKM